MEQGKLLLDLPDVDIEEILLYLNLRDRENIRLTCKRLYKLCNFPRICMKEKIIWRKIDTSIVNLQPGLLGIGRSRYNLVINCEYGDISNRQRAIILKFFEVNGAKVRSFVIESGRFANDFLEPLIISCEGLCSLTLLLTTFHFSSWMDSFKLKQITITRPTVTYLELTLPHHQPSKYLSQMLSVFPNVEQLKISLESRCRMSIEEWNLKTGRECSVIFSDVMKCGSNLKSLQLNIPLWQLSRKVLRFSNALSNLKDLSIDFHDDAALGESENLYSCFSNLASLELLNPSSFKLTRVLKNTQLNYLKIFSNKYPVMLNGESYTALLSSKLKIVHFRAPVAVLLVPGLGFLLEANRTVTDLYLSTPITESAQLFPMYFRGLVHLSIGTATDTILQLIFEYQQNLRSLDLGECSKCSAEGFCGSKDGRLQYSINNLQKLEHLSIGSVSLEVIVSDDFKNVLNFPSLEYLHIDCTYSYPKDNFDLVRPDLFEKLTNLRALRIKDALLPSSRETISWLFTNLKYLHYLRMDLRENPVVYVNSKEFYVSEVGYKRSYHIEKKSVRMVISNYNFGRKLCSPKISSYEVDWIKV